MLGRTAESLFWMSRYVERAEATARLTEAGFRITLTPRLDGDGASGEWRSTLTSAGVLDAFLARHTEVGHETALRFLLFDPANSSSVRSCIETARTNGRVVRTKITRDMWEALNMTWLGLTQVDQTAATGARLPDFLDWVRERTAQFRGAMLGTILRDDTYYFSQLGAFIERADCTARILDVKYYVLLPSNTLVGGEADTYQWETILRSVSAHRSYRHVFHDRYRPWNVAEYLILRPEMPRSLRFCYDWLARTLDDLCEFYGARSGAAELARETRALLAASQMEVIFQSGLHEFLQDFMARNNRLARQIREDYRFG